MIRRAGWLWPIGLLLTACAQSFQPAGQADARGERTDARSLAQLHLALATGYFEYGQYGSRWRPCNDHWKSIRRGTMHTICVR